ncbi:MAG: TlpA family protein disulfide reductase [Chloroflexi bacterium]|nr:TlpA family protein disulfide reductase [Chloroflexota bacterium]
MHKPTATNGSRKLDLLTGMTTAPAKPKPSPTLLVLLIIPLFGIFVALLMLALETRQQPAATRNFTPAPPRAVVNFKAPDFKLPLLDGITLVSPSDYAGRPLFLNFWATWCQPCVRELPAFEEFIAEHSDESNGPALLTINLGETAAEISGFLAKIAVQNLPVAMDINQVVKLDYGVQNLPTTFVIDGDGRVRHLKLGEMKYEEMDAYLAALEAAT